MLRFFLFSDKFPIFFMRLKTLGESILSFIVHLNGLARRPQIIKFSPTDTVIIRNGNLLLTWKTKFAWKVKLVGTGTFYFKKDALLASDFQEKNFTLVAHGYFLKTKSAISIKTLPAFKSGKTLVTIPQRKIAHVSAELSLKKVTTWTVGCPEKITIPVKVTGINLEPVSIKLPPFETGINQLNQTKLLKLPS